MFHILILFNFTLWIRASGFGLYCGNGDWRYEKGGGGGEVIVSDALIFVLLISYLILKIKALWVLVIVWVSS